MPIFFFRTNASAAFFFSTRMSNHTSLEHCFEVYFIHIDRTQRAIKVSRKFQISLPNVT